MFVIVAEGKVTEQQYFDLFDQVEGAIIRVKCLPNKNNLPPNKALKKIKEYIRNEGVTSRDEAWEEKYLEEIFLWAQEKKNFGFALSNPKFEYWLLLHFEDGKGVATARHC